MRMVLLAALAACLALGSVAGAATRGATTLRLTVSGVQLRFDKAALHAEPGKVTILLKNRSPVPHNIALRGKGVNVRGKIVGKGGTSTVTATLKRGRYVFFCSVPGHEQAGMTGTLTVS